jgi:hypothetical protein
MSLVIVLAVILAFAGSVSAALFISVDRAASLDHDPGVDLFLGGKESQRRFRAL